MRTLTILLYVMILFCSGCGVIGATAGALRGRRQQKMANKAAEQKAKEMEQQKQKEAAHAQKTAAEERMGTFRKAFSACMEARGYTVR